MLFICYPKCSTCLKAKKWLDDNNIKYEERHIVEDNPKYDEFKKWYERSGLPLVLVGFKEDEWKNRI